MTIIELLEAYRESSAGVLNATEQAVYFRLVLIWNRLRRPEWFHVSTVQLMRELKIRSHDTVDNARKGLMKKGFIQVQKMGKGVPLLFNITTPKIGEGTPIIGNVEKNTTPIIGNPPRQKSATPYADNRQGYANNQRTTTPIIGNITETENYTEIYTEGGERQQPISTPENIPPTVPDEILNSFQNKLRPLRGDELGDLAVLTEEYGTRKMLVAIDKAEARGKRDLNYVRGILRNWRDGEDDNHDNMGGNTSQGESADEWADRLAAEYHL
jgi:hypothetical protein